MQIPGGPGWLLRVRTENYIFICDFYFATIIDSSKGWNTTQHKTQHNNKRLTSHTYAHVMLFVI